MYLIDGLKSVMNMAVILQKGFTIYIAFRTYVSTDCTGQI